MSTQPANTSGIASRDLYREMLDDAQPVLGAALGGSAVVRFDSFALEELTAAASKLAAAHGLLRGYIDQQLLNRPAKSGKPEELAEVVGPKDREYYSHSG